MASTPTLTNENWHMFQPSAIETQLAVADPVRNPRAVALLPGYQAEREQGQQAYQGTLDQMHALQTAQLLQKAQSDNRTAALSAYKDSAKAPGMLTALRNNPQFRDLITGDTSQFEQATTNSAAAENVKNTGQGIGAAAQGGFTGLAPVASQIIGAPLQQGDPALVQAARIKEAGANGRHASALGAAQSGPKLSVSFDPIDGTPTIRAAPQKGGNLSLDDIAALRDQVNPLTLKGGRAANRPGATNLPPAPGRMPGGPQGNPNAFNGVAPPQSGNPLFGGLGAPAPSAPAAAPAPVATLSAPAAAAPAAAGDAALRNFARANPTGFADVAAKARANGNRTVNTVSGGKMGVVGASGQFYPLQ